MQRLENKDNRLRDMRDMVAGYEIDWLDFELATRNKSVHDSVHAAETFLDRQDGTGIKTCTRSSTATL